MKNFKILVLGALLSLSLGLQAGAIQEANQQLRSIFSGLHSPDPSVRIFYDMAAHRVDSSFYSIMCMDTTSCDTWYFLYDEVYNAAYDTTTFMTPKDVLDFANSKWVDTLCLGMIDLQYAYLLPGVLNNGDYFQFDINNNKLYDLAEYTFEKGPYGRGEVFMTAPLYRTSETLSPIFELSPTTIFWDERTRIEDIEFLRCRIDLGDGAGWHYVNPLHLNHLSAHYPSKGVYYITTEFVDNYDVVVKHSISSILIYDTKVYNDVEYEECDNAPKGLRVFEIKPKCTYNIDEKYIFVLSGYNPMSFVNHGIRTFDQLYDKYIVEGNHEILREYGYTIVLVDWEDHNDFIQANAMRFVELLEQYKCKQEGDEEFVVIGQSMGCLIGRYALTWMESDKYVPRTDCKREKRHNTRLFISNDGPHQGVNIPLSLQWLYGNVFADQSFMSAASDIVNVLTKGDINFSTTLLKGNSVKQMLYYHYSTEQSDEYFAHELHEEFLKDIESLGNYPKYCKLVAQSNGSLEGHPQQQYFSPDKWTPGLFRNPNDDMINAEIYSGFRILGMKFGITANAILKTNPYGSGPLGEVGIGVVHPQIKLYWFGVKITNTEDKITFADSVKNAIPYCIVPGGNEYLNMPERNLINFNIPLLGGFNLEINDGCINELGYIGIPWLLNVSEQFNFCTNGLGFCFVPTVSAFDFKYNGFNEMFTDYVHLNKANLFSRTPFDVVIGQYANDTTKRYNENHENIINKFVRENLTITNIQYQSFYDTARVVNRIIGDEDLWLNNMTKPWSASYSAERNIYVNIPEDFLFHEIAFSVVDERVGAYTKDNLFVASASETYDFNSYESPKIEKFDGKYIWNKSNLRDCYDDEEQISKKVMPHTSSQDITIILNDNDINISSQKTISSVEIYTIQGYQLFQYIVGQDNCKQLAFPLPNYNMMLVVVRNSDGSIYCQKIVR